MFGRLALKPAAETFQLHVPPLRMQSYALTVDKFLDHAATWAADREVVTADAGRATQRIGYAGLRERSKRLSGALQVLGLKFGDRVGTLAWNTQHHLEMYYALMGAGMVCHTLNPRLTAAHLAAMINEAENRALAVAVNLQPLLAELIPLCPGLEHIILMDGDESSVQSLADAEPQVWSYEALLERHGVLAAWGDFEEQTAAGLCYTSGTTGSPKGVLYTHRSNYLHTLRALQADAIALSSNDVLLVAVPMFHANAWGLPFAAPAVGATLILPGRHTDGASLAAIMRAEGVTIAAGIQTLWLSVLDHLDASGDELPALQRILIGGANCPEALIGRMETRLKARVQTSWGMTELSPLGTIALPRASAGESRASGRPPMGLDMKLTDAQGTRLAQQRGVVGRLKVKGASVVERYFKANADALDEEGFFDTGDLASIDADGNVSICGRSKDLIKSGGEWINPAEIEDIVGTHPAVALAAVVARQDEKWGERPVLIVEWRQGQAADGETLIRFLRGKIASWWLPDEVLDVSFMPLAATGKINKNQLRADYANGKLIASEANS
jgi:3-(methylthio)propionyl---CoA ligase